MLLVATRICRSTLKPDFRTISDFRKDNIKSLKGVFREFTERVTVDLETGFVSIDGSKFKAWNSKDRNFTIMKLDDRIKWLEDHTVEYLRLMEETDREEEKAGTLTKEELEAKLEEAEARLERYRAYRGLMDDVRRGSKGIAIIDSAHYRPYVDHVFDISDINGGVCPEIWSLDTIQQGK